MVNQVLPLPIQKYIDMSHEEVISILQEYPFYNFPKVAQILLDNKFGGIDIDEANYFGFEKNKFSNYQAIFGQVDELGKEDKTEANVSFIKEHHDTSPVLHDIHIDISENDKIDHLIRSEEEAELNYTEPVESNQEVEIEHELPVETSTEIPVISEEVIKEEMVESTIEENFVEKEIVENAPEPIFTIVDIESSERPLEILIEHEDDPIILTEVSEPIVPSVEKISIEFEPKIEEPSIEDTDKIEENILSEFPNINPAFLSKLDVLDEPILLSESVNIDKESEDLTPIEIGKIVEESEDSQNDILILDFEDKKEPIAEEIVKIEEQPLEVELNTEDEIDAEDEPSDEAHEFTSWLNNFSNKTTPILNIEKQSIETNNNINTESSIESAENENPIQWVDTPQNKDEIIKEELSIIASPKINIAKDDELEGVLKDSFFVDQMETKKTSRKTPVENRIQDEAKYSFTTLDIVSETMAILYVQQGNIPKAIEIYQKLIELFPEKSSFFASQIEKLKK